MLRGRPALASVLLCCICLPVLTQSNPLKKDPRACSQDILHLINNPNLSNCHLDVPATDNVEKSDCKLYTPDTDNIERCPRSTLNCFTEELEVLITECKNKAILRRLQKALRNLQQRMNDTWTQCPQCECYETKEVPMFLDALRSTIQITNSMYCPQRTF